MLGELSSQRNVLRQGKFSAPKFHRKVLVRVLLRLLGEGSNLGGWSPESSVCFPSQLWDVASKSSVCLSVICSMPPQGAQDLEQLHMETKLGHLVSSSVKGGEALVRPSAPWK